MMMMLIEAAEMVHLRAALEQLEQLETTVWDGCYSDEADTLINRLRALFERDLSRLERKALRADKPDEYVGR